jgi:hypothetical protein
MWFWHVVPALRRRNMAVRRLEVLRLVPSHSLQIEEVLSILGTSEDARRRCSFLLVYLGFLHPASALICTDPAAAPALGAPNQKNPSARWAQHLRATASAHLQLREALVLALRGRHRRLHVPVRRHRGRRRAGVDRPRSSLDARASVDRPRRAMSAGGLQRLRPVHALHCQRD